jgi:hypothetical protein
MVADRVVTGSVRIENNQAEIGGTMRGNHEAPSKLQVTTLGATDFIVIMTAQAELVADPAEQLRRASPVGKMTALATKPVNRSMGDPLRTANLILVTGQADTAARRPQQTRLTRGVG